MWGRHGVRFLQARPRRLGVILAGVVRRGSSEEPDPPEPPPICPCPRDRGARRPRRVATIGNRTGASRSCHAEGAHRRCPAAGIASPRPAVRPAANTARRAEARPRMLRDQGWVRREPRSHRAVGLSSASPSGLPTRVYGRVAREGPRTGGLRRQHPRGPSCGAVAPVRALPASAATARLRGPPRSRPSLTPEPSS